MDDVQITNMVIQERPSGLTVAFDWDNQTYVLEGPYASYEDCLKAVLDHIEYRYAEMVRDVLGV